MPVRLNPELGACVLLFSDIDARHVRSGAWAATWGEDFAGPALVQVIICNLPDEPNVQLLGLNERGAIIFSSEHNSQAEAKEYAEQEYPGLAATWCT